MADTIEHRFNDNGDVTVTVEPAPKKRRTRFQMGGSAHPHAERGANLYETPECMTRALCELEALPRCVWEPSAGKGRMSRVLKAYGHDVIASDLVDYPGRDVGIIPGLDFFKAAKPAAVDAIVTNPPYQGDLTPKFVEHALTFGVPVFMLLRLLFLEGSKPRRCKIIDQHLEHVWLGLDRPPALHRDGWTGPKLEKGGAPFAWFCFSPIARSRDITVRRFRWSDYVREGDAS